MQRIDGKSVLLGMGIGIIITALLGMLFFMGINTEMTNEKIIEKAKTLGMVSKSEAEIQGITYETNGNINIEVDENEGLSSVGDRLFEAGLIDSAIEFEFGMKKAGIENKIPAGTYSLKAGGSITDWAQSFKNNP